MDLNLYPVLVSGFRFQVSGVKNGKSNSRTIYIETRNLFLSNGPTLREGFIIVTAFSPETRNLKPETWEIYISFYRFSKLTKVYPY